jgi:outer membrane protein TolC
LGLQTGEIVDANTTIDTVTVWNKNSEDLIRAAAMKPIEGYISIGIASRIELKTTQTRLKTAENSVNIAKGALLPTVAVGANYVYANPNQRYFPQKNEFNGSWDAGLTVAFDLTNAFTNKFSVNEASSNLAMQKGLADVQREGVQTEIVAAYYNLQSGISKIEANRKAVIQATENYRVTTNKYTQQTATISELLDADVLLLQTKINLATAKADAENSYYKLSKVTGVF